MQYLVIYDDTGKIFTLISGDYVEPIGLQHMKVEVPEGRILIGVDINSEQHEPIFEDIPKSEVEVLKEQLEAAQEAIDFLIMGGM